MACGEFISVYWNWYSGLSWSQNVSAAFPIDWISWGKVNSDDYEDIVGCDWDCRPYVYTFFANSDGTLNPNYLEFNAGVDADKPQLVDLDEIWSYTLPELLIASNNEIRTYDGNEQGSFTLRQIIPIGIPGQNPPDYVLDYALADLDGDGYNDLVACTSDLIRTYLNNESGQLVWHQDIDAEYVQQVALGEFDYEPLYPGYPDILDPDGYPDLAFNYLEQIKIHANLGDGSGDFDDVPIWVGSMDVYMALDQCNEVIFADLVGTGAMSVICTGIDYLWQGSSREFHVFLDDSDPCPCPPKHLTGSWLDNHPHIEWVTNTEDDIDEYNIHRNISEVDAWELIATVSHPTNSYTDPEIWYNPHGYNCKVDYRVTAADLADNESLPSNTVRFAGWVIKPGSVGDYEGNMSIAIPEQTAISASPNPFNTATTLTFDLPEAAAVEIAIYNPSGQKVAQLGSGWQDAGSHQITWKASGLPAGIYFCRLEASGKTEMKKLILLK